MDEKREAQVGRSTHYNTQHLRKRKLALTFTALQNDSVRGPIDAFCHLHTKPSIPLKLATCISLLHSYPKPHTSLDQLPATFQKAHKATRRHPEANQHKTWRTKGELRRRYEHFQAINYLSISIRGKERKEEGERR